MEQLLSLGQELLKEAYKNNPSTNITISEPSLWQLLGMVINGTSGDTRIEMEKCLLSKDFTVGELNEILMLVRRALTNSSFILANGVVSDTSLKILDKYVHVLSKFYDAEIINAPKEKLSELVNTWAKTKTKGMIEKIISEDAEEDLRLCIVNALAFEADWKNAYDADSIEEGVFYNADGTESDVTMLSSMEWGFMENDWFTGFVRPYKGGEHDFMALLPRENKQEFIPMALDQLDFRNSYKTRDVYTQVDVSIPEFTYSFSQDLKSFLIGKGMTKIFEESAEFGNITVEEPLNISKIMQQCQISVDRNGTKASSLTYSIMYAGSAPPERRSIILDRPFVYGIIQRKSGMPIFSGIVNKL